MSSDIPDLSGWVLVPKVATMDMVSAVWGSSASDVWSLMLSKAPSPPIDVDAFVAAKELAARRQALEEADRVCDPLASAPDACFMSLWVAGQREAARKIRALADKPAAGGEA